MSQTSESSQAKFPVNSTNAIIGEFTRDISVTIWQGASRKNWGGG